MGVKFFLPKETTTAAESPDQESNLEPYDYQADAMFTICCRFHCSFLQKPVELAYGKYSTRTLLKIAELLYNLPVTISQSKLQL